MIRTKQVWSFLMGAAIATVLATTASAHHSVNAEFDVNKNIVATGVLTRVELINPHTYIHFDIPNAAGKVESWDFETGAPAALQRNGISVRDTLKVGESYKIVYCPPKKGGTVGLLTSILLPDGRLLAFGATNNVEAARALSK